MTDSQRVTWTAFAILGMLLTLPIFKYTLIVPLEPLIFIRNKQNVTENAEKMIYKFNHPGCVSLLLFLRLQQGGI